MREGKHTSADNAFIFGLQRQLLHVDTHDLRYIFSTNEQVDAHNLQQFHQSTAEKWKLDAFDVNLSKPETFKQRKPLLEGNQGGLETTVSLYVGCIAQIILNLNTSDGLVNGSSGIVVSVSYDVQTQDKLPENIQIVWMKFSDPEVGRKTRVKNVNLFLKYDVHDKSLVPILRIQKKFRRGETSTYFIRT
jgi:hypothetical protein